MAILKIDFSPESGYQCILKDTCPRRAGAIDREIEPTTHPRCLHAVEHRGPKQARLGLPEATRWLAVVIPRSSGLRRCFDDETLNMRMYFFDVTLKVSDHGRPAQVVLYKGARAVDEVAARRVILNQFFDRGFQVVRLDRVEERC